VKLALEPEVSRKRLFEGEGEAVIESLFAPGDFSAGIKVRLCARITIPAGGSIGHHVHRGEDELYYILSGSGRVSDVGESRDVFPGSAILTRSGEGHELSNTGTGELVLLAVIPVSRAEK
jgi:mannose-6-phosphate isomerase-like protein (cupin superfamily)